MSVVTSFILTSECGDTPDLGPIESAFGHEQKFVNVSEHAGGGKAMQGEVWLAAINHAEHADIVRAAMKINWSNRQGVSLLMKFEHGEAFEPAILGGMLTDLGLCVLAGVGSQAAPGDG